MLDPIAAAVVAELDRRARKGEAISFRRLGQVAGVNYASVHRWLRGDRGLPMPKALSVLDALGLELVIRRRRGG
jgi:hypothetical protein